MEKTKYVVQRVEQPFSDLLSDLGGYWSILAVVLTFINYFDNVQEYVVSDLLSSVKKGARAKKFPMEGDQDD